MGHLSPLYPGPPADTCLLKWSVVITSHMWVSRAVGDEPGSRVIQAWPTLRLAPPLLPRVDVPRGLHSIGTMGTSRLIEAWWAQRGTDEP